MPWLALILLLLAGIFLVVERGQGTFDRVLRWMVLLGALLMAILVGGGYFR
jgi:hypothetical protein